MISDQRQLDLRRAGDDELRRLEEARGPQRYRVRTSTGVEIGGAYIPPSPEASADMVRVQSGLLHRPRRGVWRTRAAETAKALVVFGLFAVIGVLLAKALGA